MKRIIVTSILIAVIFLQAPICTQAQNAGKKFDKPKWKMVELLEFKHDKMGRVREIIKNYFLKAADKAGSRQPASLLELATGEWNMIITWDMKEGIEEMNWQTRPDDTAWMNALTEIAGSTDKAGAILDEWSSLVVHSTSYLCRQF